MTNPFKPSPEQRIDEGKRLKRAFIDYKARTGNTQIKLCNAIELNQGLLHAYFKAEKQIPIPTLLRLCRELDVDPCTIRPSIRELIDELADLTLDKDILIRLATLSGQQRKQVLDYADFLRAKEPR